MSRAVFELLAGTLGDAVTRTGDGLPRVAPRSPDAVAAALGLAHGNGWRVRIEGRRTWMPADAPADFALTTERLDRIVSIAPGDLVATVQAGASLAEIGPALAAHRTLVALDPPGSPDRSLGSVLATGTAGPSRHRYRPVRDQVLGTTVATGDGRLVRAGGIVVKNVAGYDLSKVQIGGFGGFGVITEVNLRLWAVPVARRLLVAAGPLDPLFTAGRDLVAANLDATAIEMVSPEVTGGTEWLLLVELAGTDPGVAAETARATALASGIGLGPADPKAFTPAAGDAFLSRPVTIRAGVLPPSLPDTADLVRTVVGSGPTGLSLGSGGLRWSGSATVTALRSLRAQLAQREIPVTLERAPWPIRSELGHFGAFREGIVPLSARVRAVFDPGNVLVAPLEGGAGG